jgi:aspartate-semialdehyde dehydrogenase
MSNIRLGILGATGMAGREAIIHQKNLEEEHDYAELELVTGSPESQGKELGEVFKQKEKALSEKYSFWQPQRCPEQYRDMTVEGLDPEEISEKVDYVISALPSSIAAEIEPELRKRGVHVFSNASEFRWEDEIPLIIPEVNHEDIKMLEEQGTPGKQANNPNCTTAGYVPVIEALRSSFEVEKVDLVTLQAISGKGDKVAEDKYRSRIEGNAIDDWDRESNHNGEEVKSEIEPQKILGIASDKKAAEDTDLDIDAQTSRIPTQYGHLESVRIEFSEAVEVEDVEDTLESWQPDKKVRELPSTPENPLIILDRQPEPRGDVKLEDGMAVVLGDIRQLDDKRISFYALSHNLRRGATWTARQSMEIHLQMKDLI